MEALERQVESLRADLGRLLEDPLGRSMASGTRRIPYGTRWRSPNDAGSVYVLVREAGGNAAFVAAPAAITSWSDA